MTLSNGINFPQTFDNDCLFLLLVRSISLARWESLFTCLSMHILLLLIKEEHSGLCGPEDWCINFLCMPWQNTPNQVALNNRNLFFHSLEAKGSKSRCWQDHTIYEVWRGGSFPVSFSFWPPQELFGFWKQSYNLCFWFPMAFFPCVCVSLCLHVVFSSLCVPLLMRTPVILD